jgi:hypothetical protein
VPAATHGTEVEPEIARNTAEAVSVVAQAQDLFGGRAGRRSERIGEHLGPSADMLGRGRLDGGGVRGVCATDRFHVSISFRRE